ncbi:hypothetical protein NMY22_g13869 [Coprinellus aureogranulatus]|nr:hypothetical protein NMY22_g13869 [Coprinellus aureogranulatus]
MDSADHEDPWGIGPAPCLIMPAATRSAESERFTILPIRYPKCMKIWDMYLLARSSFWVPQEISMGADIVDWATALSDDERTSMLRILAFFATADGIVAENLVERFASEVTIPEARYFYGWQIAMENIHAETYGLILNSLVEDEKERSALIRSSLSEGSVALKTKWALKWISRRDRSFAERLIAFACVEGIFFSSSFAFIFRLKSKGVMPGLYFACLLLHHLTGKPRQETVRGIVMDAVKVESAFAAETLDPPVLGLNTVNMGTYIMFVADRLMVSMGYDKIYGVVNPYHFMNQISLPVRSNFFEQSSVEYTFPSPNENPTAEGPFPPGSFA